MWSGQNVILSRNDTLVAERVIHWIKRILKMAPTRMQTAFSLSKCMCLFIKLINCCSNLHKMSMSGSK